MAAYDYCLMTSSSDQQDIGNHMTTYDYCVMDSSSEFPVTQYDYCLSAEMVDLSSSLMGVQASYLSGMAEDTSASEMQFEELEVLGDHSGEIPVTSDDLFAVAAIAGFEYTQVGTLTGVDGVFFKNISESEEIKVDDLESYWECPVLMADAVVPTLEDIPSIWGGMEQGETSAPITCASSLVEVIAPVIEVTGEPLEHALATTLDAQAHDPAVDTGAARHMGNQAYQFINLTTFPPDQAPLIKAASGRIISATGMGTMKFLTECIQPDSTKQLVNLLLPHALYLPELQLSLISVPSLLYRQRNVRNPTGHQLILGGPDPPHFLFKNGLRCELSLRSNNLLYLPTVSAINPAASQEATEVALAATDGTHVSNQQLMDLHVAMGHYNFASVCRLFGVPDRPIQCAVCFRTKTTRQPLPLHVSLNRTATSVGEITFFDFTGPLPTSIKGDKYVLLAMDDKSGLPMSYPIPTREQPYKSIGQHIIRLKTYPAKPPISIGPGSTFHSDNELLTKGMQELCAQHRITQSACPPHTPQLNSRPERMFLTLLQGTRTLLFHSGCSIKLWPFAWLHAEYLYQRLPTSAAPHLIPLEVFRGYPLSLEEKQALKVLPAWGSRAFVHLSAVAKLEPKAREGIFIGVNSTNHSFKIYFESTNSIMHTIHVRFLSLEPPPNLTSTGPSVRSDILFDLEEDSTQSSVSPSIATVASGSGVEPSGAVIGPGGAAPALGNTATSTTEPIHVDDPSVSGVPTTVDQGTSLSSNTNADVPDDILLNIVAQSSVNPHSTIPITDACCLAALLAPQFDDPTSVRQALTGKDGSLWQAAIEKQVATIQRYGAGKLVPRADVPPGTIILPSRFVFQSKRNAEGVIIKHKARWVVGGHRERNGINFDATQIYSPVASLLASRAAVCTFAGRGWHIRHVDVEAAFLQADELTKRVYVSLPDGYPNSANTDEMVMQLIRPWYGLHDAPKDWFFTLVDRLSNECAFTQSGAEPCLFYKDLGTGQDLVLTVVVDDMIVGGPSFETLQAFEQKFATIFTLSLCEDIRLWLGIAVIYDRLNRSIFLSQSDYVSNTLKQFGMAECRPTPTPMSSNTNLLLDLDKLPVLPTQQLKQFQSMVGALLYLSNTTRPDIAFAVNACARFMAKPNATHLLAVKHVFRYLQGTRNLGLTYKAPKLPEQLNQLTTFSDSAWGGDSGDTRSISGLAVFMNGAVIAWGAQRQQTTSLSSSEAEYVAMSYAARTIAYVVPLLADMGSAQNLPTRLYGDNTSALQIAKNPVCGQRSRHINLRYHFIREKILAKEIVAVYCPTENMVADIFTKPLDKIKFRLFRDMLMGGATA